MVFLRRLFPWLNGKKLAGQSRVKILALSRVDEKENVAQGNRKSTSQTRLKSRKTPVDQSNSSKHVRRITRSGTTMTQSSLAMGQRSGTGNLF